MSLPVPLLLTVRRKQKGMSQYDLSNALNSMVSQAEISLYENGKRNPPPDVLEAIIDVLKIPDEERDNLLKPYSEVT